MHYKRKDMPMKHFILSVTVIFLCVQTLYPRQIDALEKPETSLSTCFEKTVEVASLTELAQNIADYARTCKIELPVYLCYGFDVEPNELITELQKVGPDKFGRDGQYILSNINRVFVTSCNVKRTEYIKVKVQLDYKITERQELWLTKKINTIIKNLKLSGLSDYEKFYRIYTYLLHRNEYALCEDGCTPDMTYYTAVDAMKYGKSVCNGYSQVLHRMLSRAGLTSYTIIGTSSTTSELHIWNLVRLDGVYYYVDPTWDDEFVTNTNCTIENSLYFLKGSRNFSNHQISENSTEILEQLNLNISRTDYNK